MIPRFLTITLLILAALIILILILIEPAEGAQPSGQIQLAWYYQSNLCTPDLKFKCYSTTNLSVAITNWPVLSVQSWTNCSPTNYDGTNYQMSYPVQVTPLGQRFFTVSAVNFWGESVTSNMAYTPPVALPPNNMGITRTN